MWPIVNQVIDSLRKDDPNPIHALDAWLLVEVPKLPPSTLQELAVSAEVRLGPGCKGPELRPSQLMRWVHDAGDRGLIRSRAVSDPAHPGRLTWSLTEKGVARLKALGGLKPRFGGLLGVIARRPSVWAYAIERLLQQEDVDVGKPPPKRDLPKIQASPGDREITPEKALENLQAVKHIVVLMMENRSFDHMVGYLRLIDEEKEVNGLRRELQIEYKGHRYGPEYLTSTAFPKSMDPPHGRKAIADQINGGLMDGFIESFATENDVPEPERVMGYYAYRQVPVYDFFARNFLLCDRWFSSVPSSTWHNRLYALAGTCDPDREKLIDGNERFFNKESFVRLLGDNDPDTWRWYSWDPGTLRLVDADYRPLPVTQIYDDNFRRVAQHALEPDRPTRDERDEVELALGTGFLQDAAKGDLPKVAWIDPNFVDLSILDPSSNDDHPPSDIRAGQELAMMVFRALAESPVWNETMLIVTYDEHGGFYDHEAPDPAPEGNIQFETYGVRVPAFVVSPLVEPGTVSHRTFDHTSIIRTILELFGTDDAVKKMANTAPRVPHADHLGRFLMRRPGTGATVPDYAHVSAALNSWRHGRAERRSAASAQIVEPKVGMDEEPKLTGFPADFLEGARRLREDKLPAGHP
jgi:phospholipase C